MSLKKLMRMAAAVKERPLPAPPPPTLEVSSVCEVVPVDPDAENLKDYHAFARNHPIYKQLAWKDVDGNVIDFQQRAIHDALDKLAENNWKQSALLLAPTGSGKTYFAIGLLAILHDLRKNYYKGKFIVVVTPIDHQFREDLARLGVHNVLVTTYSELRSGLGRMFIRFKTEIVEGEPREVPVWHRPESVGFIVLDEAQFVKNPGSIQAQIIQQAERAEIPILAMSATPYSRGCQTRVLACILRPDIAPPNPLTGRRLRLSEPLFASWISELCAPHRPDEWSPSAMRRVQEVLNQYTVRFRGVKYRSKLIYREIPCEFVNDFERNVYLKAFTDYQEARVKSERDPLEGFAAVLVAQMKFIQTSEILRAPHMGKMAADEYVKYVSGSGARSIIAAFEFVDALILFRDSFADRVMDMLPAKFPSKESVDAIICEVSGRNKRKRATEVSEFKRDKRHICLLMVAAGGAGLSLDHSPNNKRQRVCYAPYIWNDLLYIQLVGRAMRVLTQSNVIFRNFYYLGTEEENKRSKLKYKLKSLRAIYDHEEEALTVDASSRGDDKRRAVAADKMIAESDADVEDALKVDAPQIELVDSEDENE
jgi:hypothetical protein